EEAAQEKKVAETLAQRAAQQAIVAELGQRALAGTDLPALFDEAIARATRNLEVEYGLVMELATGGGTLTPRAGVGWRENAVGHASIGAGVESMSGFTLLGNEPVIVEDFSTEARFR